MDILDLPKKGRNTYLIQRLGLSPSTVSKIVNGYIPDARILVALSECLDCSVDFLLGTTEESKPGLSFSKQVTMVPHAWLIDQTPVPARLGFFPSVEQSSLSFFCGVDLSLTDVVSGNDVIFISSDVQNIETGKAYLLLGHGHYFLRVLNRKLDGSIEAFNPDNNESEIVAENAFSLPQDPIDNSIQIIGLVIGRLILENSRKFVR